MKSLSTDKENGSEWRTQDVGDSIKAALKLRSVLTKEGR